MLKRRGVEPRPEAGHDGDDAEKEVGPKSTWVTTAAICLLLITNAASYIDAQKWRRLGGQRSSEPCEVDALPGPLSPGPLSSAIAEVVTREQESVVEAPPAPKRKSAVAVMCCFEGPGWMQRRLSAVVANALTTLPREIPVQIFYREDDDYRRGMLLNPGLARLRETEPRLVFTRFPASYANLKRSELILSRQLWENALADRILFFGSNGAFCGNSPLGFADFNAHRYIFGDRGGLVLIRRADALGAIEAAIDTQGGGLDYVQHKHNPMQWIHSQLSRSLKRSAPTEVIRSFVASSNTTIPFAVIDTLATFDDTKRNQLLELCPEAKILFPALHSPACFGRTSALDKEACYNSLCVTNPKKSGC